MNCLNCHESVPKEAKFCPNCGQQVDNNNLNLGVLLREFFENYISLDTRFGRSLVPFFFKPGYLTLQFNQGIRKNYANPFRLYILTSILFFSGLSLYFVSLNQQNNSLVQAKLDSEQFSEFQDLDSTQNELLKKKLGSELMQSLSFTQDSSFAGSYQALSKNKQLKIKELAPELIEKYTEEQEKLKEEDSDSNMGFYAGSRGVNFSVSNIDWVLLNKHRYDQSIPDAALLDSMQFDSLTPFARFVNLQTIHVYRSDTASVTKFIVKNLSLVMLFLIPISALFLMLFFYKNRYKYVEHLINTIHMHSFSFFVLGTAYFLIHFIESETLGGFIRGLSSILILLYFFKALKTVYKRKWLGTIVRGFVATFFYLLTSIVFFVAEVFVSFLLY